MLAGPKWVVYLGGARVSFARAHVCLMHVIILAPYFKNVG